jgi:hypothetical protein
MSSLLLFQVRTISHFLLGTSSPTQSRAPTNREEPHSPYLARSLISTCASNRPIPEARQDMSVEFFVLQLLLIWPLIQGNDFFADHSNRRIAPPANSSLLHWRSLVGSFQFSARPTDVPRPNAPESISLQPRRWNFNFFPGGSSIPTLEVAAGRKKNVSGIHRSCLISLK